MAEVVAIVASVIAVIQMTDGIGNICKYYIESVRDCPSELRVILLETSMLKTLFENLQFFYNSNNNISKTISSLAGQDGPIEGCKNSITALEALFPSDFAQTNGRQTSRKRKKLTATLAALAWPLKEKRARKLLEEIGKYKSTISLVLTADSL